MKGAAKSRLAMQQFYRLIYGSTLRPQLVAVELGAVLTKAKENNRRDGITGVLLLYQERVLELLEGQRDTVSSRYMRIASDARHHDVTLFSLAPVPERAFVDWRAGRLPSTPSVEARLAELFEELGQREGLPNARRAAELMQQLAFRALPIE